jgi:hypothetical protein
LDLQRRQLFRATRSQGFLGLELKGECTMTQAAKSSSFCVSAWVKARLCVLQEPAPFRWPAGLQTL